MWNDVYFDGCSDIFFQYKYDGELFYIKCELYRPEVLSATVWAEGKEENVFLGSLKNEKGFLILEKTYPVSFLTSGNLQGKPVFFIEFGNGLILKSFTGDRALEKAEKILESIKVKEKNDLTPVIENIHNSLSRYKKETLAILQEFDWFEIDSKEEFFSLSSVKHITGSKEFLQVFQVTGKWYFAKIDENIFAVCIQKIPTLSHPMENVLDCCTDVKSGDITYHIAGIGLYEDGQYFINLHTIFPPPIT